MVFSRRVGAVHPPVKKPGKPTLANEQKIARHAGHAALRRAQKFEQTSKLAYSSSNHVSKVAWHNVCMGDQLGQGGFSEVFEVSLSRKHLAKEEGFNESSSTVGTVDTTYSDKKTKNVYALKRLKQSIVQSDQNFMIAAIDLALEAEFLARLRHTNIVKLHAVSATPLEDGFLDLAQGHFLLIDRLYGTLEERIRTWRNQKGQKRWGDSSKRDLLSLNRRVISVALPVAHAMMYLHENNIVFRDLKPTNIGFDQDNIVKLFDFGVARELQDTSKCLNGKCGSDRYMAPEVCKRLGYGFPADVYSFGILLWHICSLQVPFERTSTLEMSPWWPAHVTTTIQECLHEDPGERPTFPNVCAKLATMPVPTAHSCKSRRAGMRKWKGAKASRKKASV